jgi:hypothetical protein
MEQKGLSEEFVLRMFSITKESIVHQEVING